MAPTPDGDARTPREIKDIGPVALEWAVASDPGRWELSYAIASARLLKRSHRHSENGVGQALCGDC